MLSKQPNVDQSGYKFIEPHFASVHSVGYEPYTKMAKKDLDAWQIAYQAAFNKMQEQICKAEKVSQTVLVKEHTLALADPLTKIQLAQGMKITGSWTLSACETPKKIKRTNVTFFPDEFLRSWKPIFLIRHPALVFPSILRAVHDTSGHSISHARVYYGMTFSYQRLLFDWYCQPENQSCEAIVIDADDVILDRGVIRHLCLVTGLKYDHIQFDWQVASKSEIDALSSAGRRMLSTINGSTTALPEYAATNVYLDKEMQIWISEFGEGNAELLKTWVMDAMSDYEYLKRRKLCSLNTEEPYLGND